MKTVNARVTENGQPRKAVYLATRRKDGKHWMEIRYFNRQSRKFVKPDLVELNESVVLRMIDKTTEL